MGQNHKDRNRNKDTRNILLTVQRVLTCFNVFNLFNVFNVFFRDHNPSTKVHLKTVDMKSAGER